MFLMEITTEACKDPVLAKSLSLIHTVFSIMCILTPIILIVLASIQTASMMMNPDQKNGIQKIVKKFVAAVVVFFVPMLTDIIVNMVPGNEFSISACWDAADEVSKDIEFSTFTNYSPKDGGMGGSLSGLAAYAGITPSGGSGEGGSSDSTSSDRICKYGEILSGGMPVRIYYQNHPDCDYGKFNANESVADSGCGFTSMAMILTYLTGNYITPADVREQYPGYFVAGSGMSHGLPLKAALDYGLDTPIVISYVNSSTKDQIMNALKNDQVILIRGVYRQPFSVGPHLMVLRGLDADGKILVNNPNYEHSDYNNTGFTYEEIDAWATKAWIFQKKRVKDANFAASPNI